MKNNKENFEVMDIINLFSLFKQLENIKFDEEQTEYIRKVIKAIANEIEKLHQENDIIIKKIEDINRRLD